MKGKQQSDDTAPQAGLEESLSETPGQDQRESEADASISADVTAPSPEHSRHRLQRVKTCVLDGRADEEIFNAVPELRLIQNAKSSPLCSQILELMGKVFPRSMEHMYTSTVLSTGDHTYTSRTVVLLKDEQVICASSFRWIRPHKIFEHILVATSPEHRRMGCGRLVQAYVNLLAKRCGCEVVILHAEQLAVPFWENCGFVTLPTLQCGHQCSQVMSAGMKRTVPYGREIAHFSEAELLDAMMDARQNMQRKMQYGGLDGDSQGEQTGDKTGKVKLELVGTSGRHRQARQQKPLRFQDREQTSARPAKRRRSAKAVPSVQMEDSGSGEDEERSPANSTSTMRDDGSDESAPAARGQPRLMDELPTDLFSFGSFWQHAPPAVANMGPDEITATQLWAAMDEDYRGRGRMVSPALKIVAILHLAKAQRCVTSAFDADLLGM